MHRLEEGLTWLKSALALIPDYADAHYNMANASKALGMYDQALQHYQATLAAQPRFAEAHNNMGTVLLKQGITDKAFKSFQTALDLNPHYHQAAYNYAIALQQSGHLDNAIHYATQALQILPEYGDALALMVSLLQQACDWKGLHVVERQLDQLTREQLETGERPSEPPFLSFSRIADPGHGFNVARAWSNWLANNLYNSRPAAFTFNHRKDDRPIIIGYLSEQFRNAATAHLTAAMFRRHDRRRFRIIAYSWGEDDGSAYRRRIIDGVDLFVDIRSLSDGEAAERIHADNVDILVDLMGWMHGHRMGILARRPAPIQVNYLGYPGTTGAAFMDYILADQVVIPQEHHRFYSERVVTLPNSYQVTDPYPDCQDGVIQREDYGLPRDAVVFCSFNTDYKIEEKTFFCWMDILRAVPNSVLWLITRSITTQDNLKHAAGLQNVDPRRLAFAPPLPKDRHLARLKLADLALDTLTVNGHTTTSDMLWAGIPVVTVMGTHFASRVAASLLTAMGLNELIAPDLDGYKDMIIDLAMNTERLERLKEKVAEARDIHPLFDIDGYVRHMEKAYTFMWDLFLQNRTPETFGVG
jgi:predicted O-linked N-acetylglucosamine transferase (SPINDLY family)